jgi:hypothetical protein
MASIVSAGTTSATALNMSADTSGVLQLASNNGTVAVTVNTSQNVGVGTASPGQKLEVAGNVLLSNNQYFGVKDSTGAAVGFPIFTGSNDAIFGYLASGSTGISTYQFRTGNNVERMRITSAGDVGVNTTSPVAKLAVVGGTSNASSLATAYSLAAFNITPKSTSGYSLQFGSGPSDFAYIQMSAGGSAAGELLINPYGGRVLINSTSDVGANAPAFSVNGDSFSNIMEARWTGTTSIYHLLVRNGNGLIGGVQSSGSTTSFLTSSDYRLKNNIAPMTGALAKVALLKPVTYKWKADDTDGEGFIAHELAAVCPIAVHGEKDALNEDGSIKSQSIDTSFLVATLTAAIQELTAKVTALEAKVGASA